MFICKSNPRYGAPLISHDSSSDDEMGSEGFSILEQRETSFSIELYFKLNSMTCASYDIYCLGLKTPYLVGLCSCVCDKGEFLKSK